MDEYDWAHLVKIFILAMVKWSANVLSKLSTEVNQEQKTETSPSQAPIMEAKQLYLQILNDRSFLMENPEILNTVTLQKAGWFNEEIFNKKQSTIFYLGHLFSISQILKFWGRLNISIVFYKLKLRQTLHHLSQITAGVLSWSRIIRSLSSFRFISDE